MELRAVQWMRSTWNEVSLASRGSTEALVLVLGKLAGLVFRLPYLSMTDDLVIVHELVYKDILTATHRAAMRHIRIEFLFLTWEVVRISNIGKVFYCTFCVIGDSSRNTRAKERSTILWSSHKYSQVPAIPNNKKDLSWRRNPVATDQKSVASPSLCTLPDQELAQG